MEQNRQANIIRNALNGLLAVDEELTRHMNGESVPDLPTKENDYSEVMRIIDSISDKINQLQHLKLKSRWKGIGEVFERPEGTLSLSNDLERLRLHTNEPPRRKISLNISVPAKPEKSESIKGYLTFHAKGLFRSTKRYWFALEKSVLFYSENPSSSPLGKLDIKESHLVFSSKANRYFITIQTNGKSELKGSMIKVSTTEHTDFEKWLRALNAVK